MTKKVCLLGEPRVYETCGNIELVPIKAYQVLTEQHHASLYILVIVYVGSVVDVWSTCVGDYSD